jgi:hypothetical protein
MRLFGIHFIKKYSTDQGWIYIDRPWDNTIWCQHSPRPNLEYIDQLKQKNSRVIVDMSIDHWGGKTSGCIESTYNLLEQNFSDFVVLTHNSADHKTKENLFFYSYWYQRTRELFTPDPTNNLLQNFFVSCLNGTPKFQRKANWVILCEKPYTDKIFKRITTSDYFSSRPDDYKLDPLIIEKWDKLTDTNKRVRSDFQYSVFNHREDNSHFAYTDSYINLVTESSVLPELFVTEKTWKSIASGQLFIVLGNPGTISHLRDLGVDTFDDIIDHNYYDHEPDWYSRLIKLHQVLDNLVQQNLEEIWTSTYTRRLANQKKLRNGDFDLTYQLQVLNRLSQ